MVAISDETLIISEFLVLLLFTGFLVYRYASKKVPWHSWISVFLTWSLCFSIVALVPIDIYYVIIYIYIYTFIYIYAFRL